MKEVLNPGILYLSLHNLLRKKAGLNKTITRKEFFCYLGKHFLIPKQIKHTVIKEMTDRNLIEKLGQDKYKILEVDINIEEDVNKLYELVGLL